MLDYLPFGVAGTSIVSISVGLGLLTGSLGVGILTFGLLLPVPLIVWSLYGG